jgi:hypothetical protein
MQVLLELHMRRFACSNTTCSRRTFAEQLGEQIKAYARRTKRCTSELQTIGLMLGGACWVSFGQSQGAHRRVATKAQDQWESGPGSAGVC